MTIFKCKMCGGDLEVNESMSVGTCKYCGSTMTLPKLDDDKRANLYDRANHFRRNNEFDKAMSIYESILNEDRTDAEAYWSLVLCKYGIEYVEDPKTHRRVPTCNRTQFTSIFADEDYKQAIANADGSAKSIYEDEAKAIDEIQKGILEISFKEEPFDVFVCYKDTDTNGRRTPDSVLAHDLYYQLTQEGFKVFFSRITLEDKLGTAYEPYIFAALNSSKVMVVVGTKPEYFNSAWIKNEWGRYLALIKNGAKKNFIPAYKDMDPYDLPDEFSHLQAQDMSKLGFMQDLIRGIKKLIGADEHKTASGAKTIIPSIGPLEKLLQNADTFHKLGDYAKEREILNQITQNYPENYEAWWRLALPYIDVPYERSKNKFEELNEYRFISPENTVMPMINRPISNIHNAIKLAPSDKTKEIRNRAVDYYQSIPPFFQAENYKLNKYIEYIKIQGQIVKRAKEVVEKTREETAKKYAKVNTEEIMGEKTPRHNLSIVFLVACLSFVAYKLMLLPRDISLFWYLVCLVIILFFTYIIISPLIILIRGKEHSVAKPYYENYYSRGVAYWYQEHRDSLAEELKQEINIQFDRSSIKQGIYNNFFNGTCLLSEIEAAKKLVDLEKATTALEDIINSLENDFTN